MRGGGDKDKQNLGSSTTQESCNKEQEDQNRKGNTEGVPDHAKKTENSGVKDLNNSGKQKTAENNYMEKWKYRNNYYWFIDYDDGLYERDIFYDYYFYDESSEYCNCCAII